MYVQVREVMLGDAGPYHAAHEEFARILARTPGLRGTLSLDAGEDRHVSIVVWESVAAAQAAGPGLGPHYERLLAPHSAGPGRLVYAGPMVTQTLMPE